MIAAMMLPTTLPLVTLFRRLVGRRSDRLALTTLLTSGYVGVWLGFGVAAYAGDQVLHELVDRVGWIAARPWLIGSGLLIVAGLYQFSSLKDRCLTACRQPPSLVTHYWTGAGRRSQAWRIGTVHGLSCVGCCWPLMLLMFAAGAANLGLMLALAAVMATEKNVSWGQRLMAPIGVVLVLAGISLAALRVPLS
jgi:predicted metal-binding membrane protein